MLILGGASYYDSVYVVTGGGIKASPYFNANPGASNYCSGSGPGSGCAFDVTGSAAQQNVFVNNSSGEIDLKQTLGGSGNGNAAGVFGPNPVDGQTATATIYYQLRQGSNNALQHLDIEFVYYSSESAIPSSLMNSIDVKLGNLLGGNLISTSANPRPPLIVIVRGL